MRSVAVVGAGRLGRAIRIALASRGIPAHLLSRSTGFDVTEPSSSHRLRHVDVVVEATDIATYDAAIAKDFFTRSTRTVQAAGRAAGASKHILVSILNCADPSLQGNGYYAGKAEQERIARTEGENLTIVRSTVWFEFARQSLDRLRRGPVAIVPAMTVQPVALTAVAEVVADCAVGSRDGTVYDLAGPEVMTLHSMTACLPNKRALLIPLPLPGAAGRALRDGTLLPGNHVEKTGPRFSDWLAATGDGQDRQRRFRSAT